MSRELSKSSMLSTNLFLAFLELLLRIERASPGLAVGRVLRWRAVEMNTFEWYAECLHHEKG
jgi:hypothetical protein